MEKPRSQEQREKFWKQHLLDWRSSGQSQVEYCRQHGLSSKTFGYWKRKHKAAGAAVCLVEIPVQHKVAPPCCHPLRLMVGDRYRLEIEKGFDAEALERLLGFLERR